MVGVSEAHPEVLVIGAGPSGLFAAAELARHGVRSRVIERSPTPHHQARATALQPGTLEILAPAEVVDAVLAASLDLQHCRVFDADLRPLTESAYAGVGCRWGFQCTLPRWCTEILDGRLVELGGGVVERRHRVVARAAR
jgi:6-methylpretetramide 4-monooxygenase / 4-hydroxy-6-methylpretetramide 12a-monooxygenase